MDPRLLGVSKPFTAPGDGLAVRDRSHWLRDGQLDLGQCHYATLSSTRRREPVGNGSESEDVDSRLPLTTTVTCHACTATLPTERVLHTTTHTGIPTVLGSVRRPVAHHAVRPRQHPQGLVCPHARGMPAARSPHFQHRQHPCKCGSTVSSDAALDVAYGPALILAEVHR